MDVGAEVESTRELRQGDVVSLQWISGVSGDEPGRLETPLGVVIVSQTCDVVQDSKTNCLVAPITTSTPQTLSAARKGQAPLTLYLPSAPTVGEQLADLEQMASIPKSMLAGTILTARRSPSEQSREARDIADRLGRVFTRYPFPDEVYPSYKKLRQKAQKAVGGAGWFGKVLDRIDELRVSADQWERQGRNLTLHVVVSEDYLLPQDEADEDWNWQGSMTIGKRNGEQLATLGLDRVSELLETNLMALDADSEGVDRTSILRLWEAWVLGLETTVLEPVDDEVSQFSAELASDVEFSYADWKRSESLDLEVLSNSRSSTPDDSRDS